jgi:hypothetical protein
MDQQLKNALISAAKIFIVTLEASERTLGVSDQAPTKSASTRTEKSVLRITETSNGRYVCSRHGKVAMDKGKGPFCTSLESDPNYSNKNGYCNAKAE